jgi:predicted helicase
MTVTRHPPYFSLFPLLKIKLKSRHFDTIEAMEAESQWVLKTLTELKFQEAFKKMAESLGTVYTRGS